ncbi:MAG: ribose 5-phosphate isomerase B [Defluviitaleaceae bacterium]|nr:ribose 5-phosphate isomerase B [Defluviitaleaceae bacterium]
MKKIIAIGNDHAGVKLKNEIAVHLRSQGFEVIDFGTNDNQEPTDYPIYARNVANAVLEKKANCGILICGTGIGISIVANKMKGIRCAACSDPYSAKLSKEHNNTNILAFGARVISQGLAKMIVDSWITAEFQGGIHSKRIEMIEENNK